MLKDPLIHLVIFGAGLYLLYAMLNPAEPTRPVDTITLPAITPALISTQLAQRQDSASNAQSTATASDITQAINDEILLRQAYRLQLFEDAMIRERLINKAKFALEGQYIAPSVTEATLKAFYETHKAQYKEADTISFEQVLIKPSHREQALALLRDANAKTLTRNDLKTLQQRAFISSHFEAANQPAIEKIFGADFLAQLLSSPLGQWSGLVESKHGMHVVKVSDITLKPSNTFEAVRESVYKDWIDTQRAQWLDERLEALRAKYGIDVKEFLQDASA